MADLTRKTANLVDQNVFATTYTNYVTSANGIITFNSVTSTMSSEGVTVDIPANTVFTCIPLEVTNGILSFRIRFEGETEQDRQMVYLYDSNGEPNTIAPVTLSFAVKKITIFWSNASGGKTAAFKNFMVNAGSEPLPYEPYGWVHSLRKLTTAIDVVTNLPVTLYTDGQPVSSYTLKGNTSVSGTPSPSSPVTINGTGNKTENLFNYQDTTGITDNYYINQQGVEVYNVSYYITAPFAVLPNEDYTWQFGGTIGHNAPTIGFYDSNDSLISVATHSSGLYFYFTTPSNCAYIKISVYKHSKEEAMLHTGQSVMNYEPYGRYKISISSNGTALTPMYFSQPLYKIDTYTDDVDSSGTATYKITMQRITQISQANNFTRGFTVDIPVPAAIQTIYSNIAVGTSSLPDSADRDGKVFINSSKTYIGFGASEDFPIAGTGNPTQAERDVFQAYLQNNEVYIWYVLATPTTESVTIPTITTTGGEVTLDVDTTVKPSELDLTYHGWHEHQPQKYVYGNLSPITAFTNTTTDTRDFIRLMYVTSLDGTIQQNNQLDDISTNGSKTYTVNITKENDNLTIRHSGANRNIPIFTISGGVPIGTYTLSFDVQGHDCSTVGGVVLSNIEFNGNYWQ